ncbi:c-type cytochrome [Amorphus orientalis]|uniref:Mono/diheme cytochrome c family protein n=1 Tax=Amorphus orientalis TaxID=649198 RepID=A0AAE3VQC9_9HYPH|nr:cytochrome c [Amorphus orientalis]MDQ0316238.1 mono/diheme cytochrome c family protein [Amorphus orientalis]
MRRALLVLMVLLIAGAAGFWFLTAPRSLAEADLPDHDPDLQNGETLFWAGGCASCHAAPGASGDDLTRLGGGAELESPLGSFHVPNISPDPETGIGGWSTADFVNTLRFGVSPQGRHYYPSFPYASYQHIALEDLIDLKAFMDTLPAVDNKVAPTALPFPFSVRRGIGLWKRLYANSPGFEDNPDLSAQENRGAYLVRGPGHCGECHTPRTLLMGMDQSRWLAGAASLEGDGRVPDITPSPGGIGSWSAEDIAYYLESGFTPDYDVVGGAMAAVQVNWANVPAEDREAVAAYLKAIPAQPSAD